jgi:Ulp1 family protease
LAQKQVTMNYSQVQRWSKKDDVFRKDVLVFPINMFNHWFCVLVLQPGALLRERGEETCQIIFCDSMFESRKFIVEAVRK